MVIKLQTLCLLSPHTRFPETLGLLPTQPEGRVRWLQKLLVHANLLQLVGLGPASHLANSHMSLFCRIDLEFYTNFLLNKSHSL